MKIPEMLIIPGRGAAAAPVNIDEGLINKIQIPRNSGRRTAVDAKSSVESCELQGTG